MLRESIEVRAADGHRFNVFVVGPDSPRCDLLFMPAMGVDASYYAPFSEQLAEVGVRVGIGDLRGHGSSSLRPKRGVDFGYAEMLDADVPAALAAFHAGADTPLYLGGHSLGGQMALLYAGRAPAIQGVTLVATCLPYHACWRGFEAIRLRAIAPLFRQISNAFGYFPGDRIGFGGREARKVIHDWTYTVTHGRYYVQGSPTDWEAELAALTAPVLAVAIEGDDWTPPASVDGLVNKCTQADVVRQNAISLGPKRPHFGWVKSAESVVDLIDRFVDQSSEGR